MAKNKQKFDRSKPHVNIGTIGGIDHNKILLEEAVLMQLKDRVEMSDDKEVSKRVKIDLKDVTRMTILRIKELGIDRIVKTSNFDSEFFFEEFICTNISPSYMKMLANLVDAWNGPSEPNYYVATDKNYELYRFEP